MTRMKMILALFPRSVQYELVTDIDMLDTAKLIDAQIAWKQLNEGSNSRVRSPNSSFKIIVDIVLRVFRAAQPNPALLPIRSS